MENSIHHHHSQVSLGLADVYVNTGPSTFQWDTCAPHSLLAATGGGLLDCKYNSQYQWLGNIEFRNWKRSKGNNSQWHNVCLTTCRGKQTKYSNTCRVKQIKYLNIFKSNTQILSGASRQNTQILERSSRSNTQKLAGATRSNTRQRRRRQQTRRVWWPTGPAWRRRCSSWSAARSMSRNFLVERPDLKKPNG